METLELGTVIAERTLIAADTGSPVLLSIGTPRPVADGEWACPFQIAGIGNPIIGQVCGIDSLQALQLVSLALRAELEKVGCSLTFLDSTNWQSNFPRFVSDFGERDLRERIESLIIEEQALWLEERGVQASHLPGN